MDDTRKYHSQCTKDDVIWKKTKQNIEDWQRGKKQAPTDKWQMEKQNTRQANWSQRRENGKLMMTEDSGEMN